MSEVIRVWEEVAGRRRLGLRMGEECVYELIRKKEGDVEEVET